MGIALPSLSDRSPIALRSLSDRPPIALRSLSHRSPIALRSLSHRSPIALRSLGAVCNGHSACVTDVRRWWWVSLTVGGGSRPCWCYVYIHIHMCVYTPQH